MQAYRHSPYGYECFSRLLYQWKNGRGAIFFFFITYIHHSRFIPKGLAEKFQTPTFYQNILAMRNTADVTDGKPIALRSQSIVGVSDIHPLVTFYDIHGRKREVVFFSHETLFYYLFLIKQAVKAFAYLFL
jgi:hypothetical protein